MKIVYKFFAVKPIVAEHPIGSGLIVTYQPGEEVPASEWGRAADNLVELGKIARVAFNVGEDVDEAQPLVAYIESQPDTDPDALQVTQVDGYVEPAPKKPRGRPKKVTG